MDLKKKSIMETQFAWIFILIVGAVILIFFVGVSKSQRESAEIKSSGIFSKEFDAILAGVGISVGTSHKLYLPRIDILMDCNTYTVGYASNNMENKIVFAPQRIKGDALVAWTLSWDNPFKITNFILLTSSDFRYIIVEDGTSEASELFDRLPDELLKHKMSPIDSLTDLKSYQVKFIFINNDNVIDSSLPLYLSSNNKNDITAINIKPDDDEVEFYVMDNDKKFLFAGKAPYFGEASKYAAIFAEDKEFYSCSMNKAFERLKFISYIHYKRAEELKGLSYSLCEAPAYYGSGFDNPLEEMYHNAVFDMDGVVNLKSWSDSIKSNNLNLMQNDCPPIY